MPAIADKLGRASLPTDNAIATTVKTTRAPGVLVIDAIDLSKYPIDTPLFFVTYKKTTDPLTGVVSISSLVSYKALVNTGANTLTNLTVAPGYTDLGNAVGDFIESIPTSFWENSLIDALQKSHNPDGSVIIGQGEATGVVKQFAGAAAPSSYLMCDGASYLRADYPALFTVIGTTYGSVDGTHFNVPDVRGRTVVGVGSGSYIETIPAASINTTTEQLTISAVGGGQLPTGTPVVASTSGIIPGGLVAATTYYVIAVDATHIKLATNQANAAAGTAIDITSTGTGNLILTLNLSARALAALGGEEKHQLLTAEIPAHNHQKAGQHGASGNAFADYDAWSNVGGSAGGGAGFTNNTGGDGGHNNMQPFLALNYIIKT